MSPRALVLLLAAVLLAAGCSAPARSSQDGTITVFAASSLRQVMAQLAGVYQEQHPGSTVQVSFGGSAELVASLGEGARADVLATADLATMARAGIPGPAVPFASNTMALVVPTGNPARISSLADAAQPAVRLVVCAPQVPCGAAAARIATAAGVQWRPVSEPNNVADVLGAVASGQADAGIVYATDVRAGTVVQIPIPPQQNTSTTYPVAALTDAGRGFAAFLTGPQAQEVLTDAGFGPP